MNEVASAAAKEAPVLEAPQFGPGTVRALRALLALLPVAVLALALYGVQPAELLAFSPELVLIAAALVFPLAPRKLKSNAPLAAGACVAILASMALTLDMLVADVFAGPGIVLLGGSRLAIANHALAVDAFSLTFNLIFLGAGLLVAAASYSPEVEHATYQGVYFMLLLLTLVGTMIVASSTSLITVFLGLELAGIATYAMVAFVKTNKLSSEAAVKYYIIGSTSTALVLFGLSYLYGITGSLDISTISRRLAGVSPSDSGVVLAIVFLVGGFGFKMAAVPFHLWAPDTYVGAPSPVSALLAAGTKKMGFAAAFKVVVVGMAAARAEWSLAFGVLAVLTMTFGNIAAMKQDNFKRLLAYSSIAQAGYILVALSVAGSGGAAAQNAVAAGIFHSLTHMVMKAGAFILVGMLVALQVGDDIEDLRGLRERAPWTTFVLVILMLSLVGFPLLAGFWSKYYIALAGIQAGGWGYLVLVIVLLVNSAMSLYYYARVIRVAYFTEAPEGAPAIEEPRHIRAVLAACVFFVLVVGLFPEPLFVLTQEAARALLALA